MNNIYRLFLWFLLATLVACAGAGQGSHASKAEYRASLVAQYLTGAEIQAETTEQRRMIYKALEDMLVLSKHDLRKARYGESQKTLVRVLNSHIVPEDRRVSVEDADFYDYGSDPRVREAVKSLTDQLADHLTDEE